MTAQSNYARIVKYRIAKHLRGECLAGGCHEKAKYLCPKHLAKANEYNKRSYQNKKHNKPQD
jgi:hypothetical protein